MGILVRKFDLGAVNLQQTTYSDNDGNKEIHALASINDTMMDFEHQLAAIHDAWAQVAAAENVKPAFLRIFFSDIANQEGSVLKSFEGHTFPISMIQQAPANGTKIAMWAVYLTGAETKMLDNGLFEVKSGHGRFYFAASMTDPEGTSEEQADKIMRRYIRQLGDMNMTLADDCQRTWFYVNDIDNNYHGMVVARNKVFAEERLTTETHFIASTGIGGRSANPHALVTMDAVAIPGLGSSKIHYLYAPERLNRTSEYGVSFERGTALDLDGQRKIFISGTASIDNKGKVVFEKDILGQADRMIGNIEALLKEAGAGLGDVQEAVVYLRDPADYQIVKNFLDTRYPDFPHIIVLAHVCRSGWLIETECMAAL
jgi:enamine deaminase RidA (YjgF/YER057c/UK114 family)